MKALQDMCELVNASKGQMIFTLVAHKSIHDYGKTIDKSVKNSFRGVEGRIKEIDFVVSAQNNYELIADTIEKKSQSFQRHTKSGKISLSMETLWRKHIMCHASKSFCRE